MLRIFLTLMSLILIPVSAYALEKDYQNQWCELNDGVVTNGSYEYPLEDDTRIDCLTKTHAVEFDFCSKWAECSMQALHYARMIGKPAKCVLICEPGEERFITRFANNAIYYKLPIEVEMVKK